MSSRSMNVSSLSDAVRLDLSDKDIFGRENDIKILQDSLERITHDEGTLELLLITGTIRDREIMLG